jgi:sucrose-6-phosphate hydrolase SacC (GH32 family)
MLVAVTRFLWIALAAFMFVPTVRADSTTRPAMLYADDTHLGRPFAKDPSVIRFGDRYLMYYSVPPKDKAAGWGIGIAESHDLTSWKKAGEIAPEQQIERRGICAPGARVIGGKVHLFYQNYTASPLDAICHAVSTDGIHFDRDASNPIFRPTGTWNNGRAIDAEVIEWHDKLWLFCATRDPAGKIQMITGATTDPHGDLGRGHWTQIGNGPLLRPTLPWEQSCIEAPTVAVRGDKLVMFYAGAYNNAPQQIGSAESSDGITWKRLSDTPLIPNGHAGDWNESESGHPGYFEDTDGRSYLFYQGNRDRGRTWYLSKVELDWSNGKPIVKKQ